LHGRVAHGLIILVDAFGAFEREGWSSGRAAPYHHGLGAITCRPAEALLDLARVRAGSSVLDVATGPGYVAGRAASRGATVVGVDFSEEMLALAASLHPGVRFQQADAGALPFADGAFDAVVAAFLMPHVSDLPAVCAELARVVRPGGRVALATWDPEPESFTRFLFESIAGSGAVPPASLPPGPPFFQYAGSDDFTALLSGAGLSEVSVSALAFSHRVTDLDAFWADLVGGAVRASVLIRAQPIELQGRIRRMYGERLERWRVAGGWDVACAVKLGAATRS
jgi:SAM-dependent methyltransferase